MSSFPALVGKAPTVAIVLVHYFGDGLARDAIRSILRTEGVEWELIIVDNGSTSEERRQARELLGSRGRFLETGRNLGYSGGANLGIKTGLANGADIVIVANQDIVVGPNAIASLVDIANREGLGVFSPVIMSSRLGGGKFAGGMVNLWTGTSRNLSAPINPSSPYDVDFVAGSFLGIRREVLDRIGLLDEDFFFLWEEVDFCFRARRYGYLVRVIPKVEILHIGDMSGVPGARLMLATRNRWLFVRKHATVLQAATFSLLRAAVMLPLRPLFAARSPRPFDDLRFYYRGTWSAVSSFIRRDFRFAHPEMLGNSRA